MEGQDSELALAGLPQLGGALQQPHQAADFTGSRHEDENGLGILPHCCQLGSTLPVLHFTTLSLQAGLHAKWAVIMLNFP